MSVATQTAMSTSPESIPTRYETLVDKRWNTVTAFLRKIDSKNKSFNNQMSTIDGIISLQRDFYARSLASSGKFFETGETDHKDAATKLYDRANVLDNTIAEEILKVMIIVQRENLVRESQLGTFRDITCTLTNLQVVGTEYLDKLRDPERALNDLDRITEHSLKISEILGRLQALTDTFNP